MQFDGSELMNLDLADGSTPTITDATIALNNNMASFHHTTMRASVLRYWRNDSDTACSSNLCTVS